MRLICGPRHFALRGRAADLAVDLYSQSRTQDRARAGEAVRNRIIESRFRCDRRAWDLLSIALSVITADFAALRSASPDGWTREFELDVAVTDPSFWNQHALALAKALAFLTTDRWTLRFHPGGMDAPVPAIPQRPPHDSIVLLSGGLDSLVGAIDLTSGGRSPLAISQTVRGDAATQRRFAARIGGGLNHLQMSHAAHVPGNRETSQRSRSLMFLAFGVLAATALACYRNVDAVPLYVCENGFIALNPPLTGGRIGSLSTRTAHPEFLGRLQHILDAAGLRVQITNPYTAFTKGEMLLECTDQSLLTDLAATSTSCGRFNRFGYRHCGRCVPCQIRRAAFLAWDVPDTTEYVYENLGLPGSDYSAFDDVRSVAVALASIQMQGVRAWVRSSLASPFIDDRLELAEMAKRALAELRNLHSAYGVR